ncbi:amidase [Salinicola corii]|uniref:Amidase n=1 Tax=Salinicola corii TaxID=2606937 RepID=A0A640WIC7_9GAMM|nr:amidase [Salinicola corii]KAA0020292.1 amidase [Salinicola corii]
MPIENFAIASLDTLLAGLDARRWRAIDLVEAALARIEAFDKQGPTLRAVTYVFADEARAAATASDERRRMGCSLGLLEGIPILVKDNMDVAGWPTTAGSCALIGLIAQQDAEIVRRLRQAGAVIVGKTAMHELAAGITGASSLTGFARNPHALDRSPGGSSSGAAVAVAAGYVPLAIGSDTAGSVRIPAAFNHLFGLRASRGALPLQGILPLSPTQDMPGPITRYAVDLERAFAALSGQPYPMSEVGTDFSIGVLDTWFGDEQAASRDISAVAYRAVERFETLGVRCAPIDFNGLKGAVDSANVIAYEFASALTADLAARPDSPVDSLKTIVEQGRHHEQMAAVLRDRAYHAGPDSPEYQQARARQDALREQIESAMIDQGLDLLCYPTLRHPPTTLGGTQDGSNALLAPVTGMPAINLPIGLDSQGLPVGLELLARSGHEAILLAAAHAWAETSSGWSLPRAIQNQ